MTNVDTYGGDRTPLKMPEEERISQLAEIARKALGHPLDPVTFSALVQIHERLWQEDEFLDRSLENKQIEPDEYLDQMKKAMTKAMDASRGILGVESFDRIFGNAGLDPEISIDREAFLHDHA